MNPYDFVQLGQAATRSPMKKRGHDHFTGLSGVLTCRLTAETHLFVPGYRAGGAGRTLQHESLSFCRGGPSKMPIIPGTSLKGVLRTVAEAVSGACFIYDNLRYERNSVEYDLAQSYTHCNDIERLCPACRIFGLLNGRSVFSGLVTVGDARATGAVQTEMLTLGVLSAPKPRHRPFYGRVGQPRQLRGRKFYYHHLPEHIITRTQRDGQNKTVEAAKPGTTFIFDVTYTNLTEQELALLLYAIVLEPEMRHKVGMGKPVGLGSAHIEIVRWQPLDRAARYHTLAGGWGAALEGDALTQEVAGHISRYGASTLQDGPLADLRRIWHWPPDPAVTIRYPDQAWFKANPSVPLEQAP
jgi:CRISPR/Cas system CSM-associated protein Csm3 (group 7 of RAMP superfamily)